MFPNIAISIRISITSTISVGGPHIGNKTSHHFHATKPVIFSTNAMMANIPQIEDIPIHNSSSDIFLIILTLYRLFV